MNAGIFRKKSGYYAGSIWLFLGQVITIGGHERYICESQDIPGFICIFAPDQLEIA